MNKRYFKCISENSFVKYSKEQQNIFDGIMLSDGTISKDSNLFSVTQKTDREQYLNYICKLLNIEENRIKRLVRKPDKRTGKCYKTSYLRTLSDYKYILERKRWYLNGKKIVPRDINLSRELLLQWFLGDGSAGIYKRSTILCLCTNSFTKEDNEFLVSKLKEININSKINSQNMICVKKDSYKTFYNYIGECPIDCFRYKWINLNS